MIRETHISIENERKLLQQMSSGCGTQQNDSKDEPTYAESLELQVFSYPTQPNDGDPESFVLLPSSLKPDNLDGGDQSTKQAIDRKASTPTICGSAENINQIPKLMKLKENSNAVNKSYSYASPTSQCSKSERKLSVSGSINHNEFSIPRLMSDQSINSISNDHEEMFSQQNLRDELLSCDKKELFQFLNDDFDNSHNYFSDTVGYGSAIMDPDTDSLVFDSKRDTSLFSSVRKASTTSNKSNLSYISNSIFETLEQNRGGSISESIDRKSLKQNKVTETYPHCDELEPLVQDSEFENIIASFEKELSSIKNSTCSLQRQLSAISRTPDAQQAKGSFDKSSSTNTYEEILPMRQNTVNSNQSTRDSVKLKRRSLEKQMKIDDDFNVSHEIKKICDNMQAPFADPHIKQSTSYSSASTDVINSLVLSPKPRRKSEFHSSLDRIKRSSLIDRVDESLLENELNGGQQTDQQELVYHSRSERLPRKYLNADMNIESLSLKSTGSYEHLVCHTENKELQKKIRFQKSSEDNESSMTDKEKSDKITGDEGIDGDASKGN